MPTRTIGARHVAPAWMPVLLVLVRQVGLWEDARRHVSARCALGGYMRTAYVLVAAMACAGCRVDFEKVPRCNPNSPFGAPVPISEINTDKSEEFAYLSPDEKTMYFSSDRPGTLGRYDIFTATRSMVDALWGNVVRVPGVNTSTGNERRPMVTGDGKTMYALIDGSSDGDIGIATQIGMTATFTSFTPATISAVGFDDQPGTILPDDSAIWFSSKRSNDNLEIYRAPRTNVGFGTAVLASGVNDPNAADWYPVVTSDELTLFFSRNRGAGAAGYEILVAMRASVADAFDGVEPVHEVSAAGFNLPTWVSADGCVLYTMSAPMQGGPYDMFVATRGM
jgi:hypothetical protein